MTRKKAIKTIMSVTCHGDKRAANNTFDAVKKHNAGNPSNVTVLYRKLVLIYNRASADPEPGFYTFKTIARAGVFADNLRFRYGPAVGGTLIEETESEA